MKLNKFDVNDFVNKCFEMKCLFLYKDVYIQGIIEKSENFLNIYLYDLSTKNYKFLQESQYKYIKLYAVIE